MSGVSDEGAAGVLSEEAEKAAQKAVSNIDCHESSNY